MSADAELAMQQAQQETCARSISKAQLAVEVKLDARDQLNSNHQKQQRSLHTLADNVQQVRRC